MSQIAATPTIAINGHLARLTSVDWVRDYDPPQPREIEAVAEIESELYALAQSSLINGHDVALELNAVRYRATCVAFQPIALPEPVHARTSWLLLAIESESNRILECCASGFGSAVGAFVHHPSPCVVRLAPR